MNIMHIPIRCKKCGYETTTGRAVYLGLATTMGAQVYPDPLFCEEGVEHEYEDIKDES